MTQTVTTLFEHIDTNEMDVNGTRTSCWTEARLWPLLLISLLPLHSNSTRRNISVIAYVSRPRYNHLPTLSRVLPMVSRHARYLRTCWPALLVMWYLQLVIGGIYSYSFRTAASAWPREVSRRYLYSWELNRNNYRRVPLRGCVISIIRPGLSLSEIESSLWSGAYCAQGCG